VVFFPAIRVEQVYAGSASHKENKSTKENGKLGKNPGIMRIENRLRSPYRTYIISVEKGG